MRKGYPSGDKYDVKECVPDVFIKTLGPLLVESLRESEEGSESMMEVGDIGNHQTAAVARKALEILGAKVQSLVQLNLETLFAQRWIV